MRSPWSSPTRSERASTSSRTATTTWMPISAAGRGCCTRSSGFPASRPSETVPASDEWVHPPGSLLAEVFGSWRLPPVVGRVEPGGSLELDKLWRIAQARTDKPVKLGTVSTQFIASMLELRTDDYAANKRDLMWDMATAMNRELRKLADAGCRVIQIEEPLHALRRLDLARRALPRLPDRVLQPRDLGARGRRGLGAHVLGQRQHAACARADVLRGGDRDLPRARRRRRLDGRDEGSRSTPTSSSSVPTATGCGRSSRSAS